MSDQSSIHAVAMSDRLAFPVYNPKVFFNFFVEFFRKITVETVKQA